MGWAEDARKKRAVGVIGSMAGGLGGGMAIGGPGEPGGPGGNVRDRFGKALAPGDLVLYRPVHDLVYQVVAVERAHVLDPSRPPSPNMILVLEITVPLEMPPDRPGMNLVKIGHLERQGDAREDQGGVGGTGRGQGSGAGDRDPGGAPGGDPTSPVPPAEPAEPGEQAPEPGDPPQPPLVPAARAHEAGEEGGDRDPGAGEEAGDRDPGWLPSPETLG